VLAVENEIQMLQYSKDYLRKESIPEPSTHFFHGRESITCLEDRVGSSVCTL